MTLHMIGVGLSDETDITLKGFETIKKADVVYLEHYTSKLKCHIDHLEKLYGRKIILANREMVENNFEQTILHDAQSKEVAFLVIGDVFAATTHASIYLEARKKRIPVYIINNASVLTAVGVTGLELYKFGKVTSIPFPGPGFEPNGFFNDLKRNQRIGLHTLFLLDLRPSDQRFMTANEAVGTLLEVGTSLKDKKTFTEQTLCVGCARLGATNQKIVFGEARQLSNIDFGPPLHCLIVPGKLHFMEEEILHLYHV